MDPVSVIVTALATGAAAGLKPTAEKFIKDAYEGIKSLITRKYSSKVNVGLLDGDPASKLKQEVVKEDLAKAGAGADSELLAQAKAILELIKKHAPEVPETIGVKLEDIEGGILTIDNIVSSGSGVVVSKAKIGGEIKISGVRAGGGGNSPNP